MGLIHTVKILAGQPKEIRYDFIVDELQLLRTRLAAEAEREGR